MDLPIHEGRRTPVESLVNTLLSKIKTLNETVWESRASEPAIAEWLDNFAPAAPPPRDERTHALFLLSNFMYFGDRQIRELLKALYRDLYRYPIIAAIRRANHDTLESGIVEPLFRAELDRTRFLGVGNPSESGCHLLYYFRQENGLPKTLFIHTHQLFSRSGAAAPPQLRDPAIKRYVFIDDFCGSGKQGTEYSHDLVEEIKRLNADAMVEYYVLFATTQGISKVRNETRFDSAKAIYELDISFKCFSPTSRYFETPPPPPEVDKAFCEQMCRTYGASMVAGPHILGYDDSQLLLGFHHNTPDNTLPVIWFDRPGPFAWKAIFRRYPKLEW
jgi:hypothetical protein